MADCVPAIIGQPFRRVDDTHGAQGPTAQAGVLTCFRGEPGQTVGGDETVVDCGGRRHDSLLYQFSAHIPEVFEALHGDTVDVVLVRQHCDVLVQPDVRQFPSEKLAQPRIFVGWCCSQNLAIVNPWRVYRRHPTQAVYSPDPSLVGRAVRPRPGATWAKCERMARESWAKAEK